MNFGTKRGLSKKLLTAGLIAALPLMLQPVAAQSPAGVKGTVFASADGAPLPGARVHLMQIGTQKTFTSAACDANGRFDLTGLPPASYEAAVEFEGGLYAVQGPVVVTEAQGVQLNLSIPKRVGPSDSPPRHSVAGAAGLMASPLGASLLVVGTALSVGALVDSMTDDDDEIASPF